MELEENVYNWAKTHIFEVWKKAFDFVTWIWKEKKKKKKKKKKKNQKNINSGNSVFNLIVGSFTGHLIWGFD